MKRLVDSLIIIGAMAILFSTNYQKQSYAESYKGGGTYSYKNYEYKSTTNTLYGISNDTTSVRPLNTWAWSRRVQEVQVVRKSSHTLYLNFDLYVDTYSYVVPVATMAYVLDGVLATELKDNIFTFSAESDFFSIYVDSNSASESVDIRIIGIGW